MEAERSAAQDRDCCWIGDPCLIHNPPPSESAICQDCKATVTPSGYCVMCGRYNDDKPTSGVKRMSDHASDCPAWSGSVCRCESPAAKKLLSEELIEERREEQRRENEQDAAWPRINLRWASRRLREAKSAKQRTLVIAALCDLRDIVDQFIDGEASLQDLGAALDRTYKVPHV